MNRNARLVNKDSPNRNLNYIAQYKYNNPSQGYKYYEAIRRVRMKALQNEQS